MKCVEGFRKFFRCVEQCSFSFFDLYYNRNGCVSERNQGTISATADLMSAGREKRRGEDLGYRNPETIPSIASRFLYCFSFTGTTRSQPPTLVTVRLVLLRLVPKPKAPLSPPLSVSGGAGYLNNFIGNIWSVRARINISPSSHGR